MFARPLAARTTLFAALALFAISLPAVAEETAEFHDPYRLDPVASPTFQSVDLKLDPGQRTYSGSTRIEMVLHEESDRFQIHAFEMDILRAELTGANGPIALTIEEGEEALQNMIAPSALPAGAYVLEMDFENDYDIRATSLYKVTYEEEDYLYTQFEATDARGAFPCFDEPQFKIEWQVTMSVPVGDVALTNTPPEEISVEGEFETTRFMRTKPMPSYLIALAVGPFEFVPVEGTSTPCRIVTPKGKAWMAKDAAENTPPILAALEDYFDRPYPYRKLDLIAVPEFNPGAMENVGLITYRETILLLDPATATVAQKRTLSAVNAHEIAHQWYGNLVTMEWWDDLWLNESFASWMGDKITKQVFPEFGMDITTVRGNEGAKNSDTSAAVNAIRAPVMSNAVFESMDASITYSKGQAVLEMFESFVGEELFREGVRNYINQNEWGSAVAADLLENLSESSGVDFHTAMGTFLDQPGVPDVSVTPLGDGKVELAQSRFQFLDQELTQEMPWHVPVVLKYSDGSQVREHRVMLTEPSEVIELPGGADPEWIHPNSNETGYYRWDVGPEKLLEMVAIAQETFTPRERVAMVEQVSAQMRAGRITGGDYLEATTVLLNDEHPEVVNTALGNLGEVRMAFVTAELMPAFRAWVRHSVGPLVERYGLTPQEGEDESVSLVRPSLITWMGNWGADPEVRAFAREVTEAYLADRQSVDGSIAGPCLRIAAIDGDWRLYNTFKKEFAAASVPAERARFLSALGRFQNWSMQEAALDFTLSGELRPQELFTIPQGVGMNSWEEPGRMWNWFVENYDRIVELMPPQFKTYMPFFAGGCEEERLVAAREFFAIEEHQAPGQDRIMERVAEGVMECVNLRRREGPTVQQFLVERESR
jgi:alanyl aminopeptidase